MKETARPGHFHTEAFTEKQVLWVLARSETRSFHGCEYSSRGLLCCEAL